MSAYGEWAPTETAPKDGAEILCFTRHGDYEISHWNKNFRCWVSKRSFFVEATHWTYLPKPPTRAQPVGPGSGKDPQRA